MKERRAHERVVFVTNVLVRWAEGESFESVVCLDLGLGGVKVETGTDVREAAACTVELYLGGSAPPVCLVIEGRVARVEANAVGIRFEKMDVESYAHLKGIVKFNRNEPEA